MFSKTLIIQTRINRSSYNQNWRHSIIKEVNIPNNILMVIKTLFSNGGSSQYESENSAPQLFNFVDKYIKEPQLFMEKCPEFETICSREYKKIEEMKEAHRQNIDDFRQHYSDFKELQADIKKLQADIKKNKEEKEKLALVKLALNNLASEINEEREAIARERAELDSMKSVKIDLDSYFEN
jgi:hypothetical protein